MLDAPRAEPNFNALLTERDDDSGIDVDGCEDANCTRLPEMQLSY
jgi:hypothetical protein